MDVDRQREEVDRNYDAFTRVLADLLPEHRDQWVLMRSEKIVGIYVKPGEANLAGVEQFEDGIYSIQEITDEPIDLGFWSHVAFH